MRTVRLKGLTFRITQPYGLRVPYLTARRDHAEIPVEDDEGLPHDVDDCVGEGMPILILLSFVGPDGPVVLAELTAMAGETAGPDGDPYAASLSTVGRSLQFCIGFVASSAATTAEIPIFR